jgi:hypothetical protein
VSKSTAQELRIAQLEKALENNGEDGSDDEDQEPAVGTKRKRAAAARADGESVMQRLGLTNKRQQQ